MLKEVLEYALGRRGNTHERVDDLKSIMFPRVLNIGGEPLDKDIGVKWGKEGWRHNSLINLQSTQSDGVGGIAGIWHSNKAGTYYFYLHLRGLGCFY